MPSRRTGGSTWSNSSGDRATGSAASHRRLLCMFGRLEPPEYEANFRQRSLDNETDIVGVIALVAFPVCSALFSHDATIG